MAANLHLSRLFMTRNQLPKDSVPADSRRLKLYLKDRCLTRGRALDGGQSFGRENRELGAARERLPDAESGQGGGVEAVEAHGRPAVALDRLNKSFQLGAMSFVLAPEPPRAAAAVSIEPGLPKV